MEISGKLGEKGVPDLLQGLAALGESGVMELFDARGLAAEVGFVEGGPRWARCQHLVGEEALLGCLFWYEGTYRFLTGKQPIPHAASLPEGWLLSRFLVHAVYLADELEKRRLLVPPPAAPLALRQPFSGEDPFGCGVDRVVAALEGAGPVTLQHLEATLPLAPVKVRLAVAYLVEQGVLPQPQVETPTESSDRYSRWWAQVAARYGASLRVLVLADESTCTREAFGELVSFLTKELKVATPWVSYSPSGPSFARLHPASGGILSLCCLPKPWGNPADCLALAPAHDLVIAVGDAHDECQAMLRTLGLPVRSFASWEEVLHGFADMNFLEKGGGA